MAFDLEDDAYAKVERLKGYAIVVGINGYSKGITKLRTAVPDAIAVAKALAKSPHHYQVHLLIDKASQALAQAASLSQEPVERIVLVEDATAATIWETFRAVASGIPDDSTLIFYFGGHGLSLPLKDRPHGFLLPADARLINGKMDSASCIEMSTIHDFLSGMPCRHVLAILDCCFAGAIRWGTAPLTRNVETTLLHRYTYEQYLKNKARQVIVSAADDEKAVEYKRDSDLHLTDDAPVTNLHSPFASLLLTAITPDFPRPSWVQQPPPGKGGVLTITELALYLCQGFGPVLEEHEQTPQIWKLKDHGKGEYILYTTENEPDLAKTPKLEETPNPYRQLSTFEISDKRRFYGRKVATEALLKLVYEQPFVAILGESGSGKSSLMRAGLVPAWSPELLDPAATGKGNKVLLVADTTVEKHEPCPIRPGSRPMGELRKLPWPEGAMQPAPPPDFPTPGDTDSRRWLATCVEAWLGVLPPEGQVLLCIDQLEEIVTLGKEAGKDTREQDFFLEQISTALQQHQIQSEKGPDVGRLRVVVTLRSDHIGAFSTERWLKELMTKEALYRVPTPSDMELREMIVMPAAAIALEFEDIEVVNELVKEVHLAPGPLPLLSCTLWELYNDLIERNRTSGQSSRILKLPDNFIEKGGVSGALGRIGDDLLDDIRPKALPNASREENTLSRTIKENVFDILLMRFVTLEGANRAKRRVARHELQYPAAIESEKNDILEKLISRRLIVKGTQEATVTRPEEQYWELCHDRILLGWNYYSELIRKNQTSINTQRRLGADMADNVAKAAKPKPEAEVLWNNNNRLNEVAELLKKEKKSPEKPTWLNSQERVFIEASIERRRQRTVITWTVVAIALALIFYYAQNARINELTSIQSAQTAQLRKEEAQRANAITQLRVAESYSNEENNAEAMLWAIKSYNTDPDYRAARYYIDILTLQAAWPLREAESELPKDPVSGNVNYIEVARYSPDGKYIELNEGNSTQIWDAIDLKHLPAASSSLATPGTLSKVSHENVISEKVSPNGKYRATIQYNNQQPGSKYFLKAWDKSGQLLRTIQSVNKIDHLAFSSDSNQIIIAEDDLIRVFEVLKWTESQYDTKKVKESHGDGDLFKIVSHSRMDCIYVCYRANQVNSDFIYQLNGNGKLPNLMANFDKSENNDEVYNDGTSLGIDNSGTRIYATHLNGKAQTIDFDVWDISGTMPNRLWHATESVNKADSEDGVYSNQVELSYDGRYLLTGNGFNSGIKLRNMDDGSIYGIVPNSGYPTVFAPDSLKLASCERQESLVLWSFANNTLMPQIAEIKEDRKTILSGNESSVFRLNFDSSKSVYYVENVKTHTRTYLKNLISSIYQHALLTRDGRFALFVDKNMETTVYDLVGRKIYPISENLYSSVNNPKIVYDEKKNALILYTVSGTFTVSQIVIDLLTKRSQSTLNYSFSQGKGDGASLQNFEISRDGSVLLAYIRRRIYLICTETGINLAKPFEDSFGFSSVHFSPDENYIIGYTTDNKELRYPIHLQVNDKVLIELINKFISYEWRGNVLDIKMPILAPQLRAIVSQNEVGNAQLKQLVDWITRRTDPFNQAVYPGSTQTVEEYIRLQFSRMEKAKNEPSYKKTAILAHLEAHLKRMTSNDARWNIFWDKWNSSKAIIFPKPSPN
ncbi:hypothetical protein DB346_08075 [Verrucomicrobia bacterium LW23]|nr:hypothetical protein DB346_08075 [Verrucomicrobia bacterium LW23]